MLLRNLVADSNDRCVMRIPIKVVIEIFQRTVRSLGVQKVDNWQEGDVQDRED